MAMSATPKATLYLSKGSLWASVPELGLIEKGYSAQDYTLKPVDLFKGENFCPEFLRLNPNGTIPLLVVPIINPEPDHPQKFKSLTDSAKILEFLDVSRKPHTGGGGGQQQQDHQNEKPAPTLSPAMIDSKIESDKLIGLVHDESHDLNFLMLGCLDSEEIEKKSGKDSLMKIYIENRILALEKYLNDNQSATNATKAFWEDRLKSGKEILDIFLKKASSGTVNEFIMRTRMIWEKSVLFLGILVKVISSHNGDFILGEQISLVDIHVGAWIARLFSILGYKQAPSSENSSTINLYNRLDQKVLKFIKKFDQKELENVCEGVEKYWKCLSFRESFRQVYVDGLH